MSEEVKNSAEIEEVKAEDVKKAKTKTAEPEMSKSKAKREQRKKEAREFKRKQKTSIIIENIVFTVIGLLFVAAVVMGIYNDATKLKPAPESVDYSVNLTEDGFIAKEDLSGVKAIGLEKLGIPTAEVAPTDETLEEEIKKLLEAHEELLDDSSLAIADQDKVNIDYVGTVDGVEFDGGSKNGADLTIGSHSFVDDFEEQLIGAHPGDEITVEVTFPEDYSEELAGKDAQFAVTVNGIYNTPEFTDEFVQEFYSDVATTTEEYRKHLYDTDLDKNVDSYITKYVNENASVEKYPNAYVKHMKDMLYFVDNQSFQYMNSMYSQMYGFSIYNTVLDYVGMSEKEYKKDLTSRAKTEVASMMTYEKLFKDNNLTVSAEKYSEVLEQYGENAESTFGKPFLMQTAMKQVVTEFIKANYVLQ